MLGLQNRYPDPPSGDLTVTTEHYDVPMHVAAARPENLYRSAQHAFSSLVVVVLLETWFTRPMAIAAATAFVILAWTLEITRRRIPEWNAFLMRHLGLIAHPHETYTINSATWFCTGLAIIAPFFAIPTLAVAVASIGFGDPAAGFVGRRFGSTKLINDRSLEGSVAYALVTFASAWAILTFWHPDLASGRAVAVAVVAGITGALTELFCRKVDDNLAVPVMVALAVGFVMRGA